MSVDTPELAADYQIIGVKQYRQGLALLDDISISRGDRVLDIGCGTGELTREIACRVGPDGYVLGIEPELTRAALAKKAAPANMQVRTGRAESLPDVADGSFDVVICNSVFHWLRNHANTLAEANRALRPGGGIAISTVSKDRTHDWRRIMESVLTAQQIANDDGNLLGPSNRISEADLRHLLQRNGFVVEGFLVRINVDEFPDIDAALRFHRASSAGRFLGALDEIESARLLERVQQGLEKFRSGDVFRLERHLMCVVGRKRENNAPNGTGRAQPCIGMHARS